MVSGLVALTTTRCVPFGGDAIAEGLALIAKGEPVAVPTETVYGLAADATRDAAVARIFAIKGRPNFNPLIVHVTDLAAARALGEFSDTAIALAEAHWPGPLTLVVPKHADAAVSHLVTAGLPTIAIRVPAHRAIRALLEQCGVPLAAPSANASGAISPTSAHHVLRTLDGRIALVIDDGATPNGLESTILAVEGTDVRLLRPGSISVTAPADTGDRVTAPGQLEAHYAPGKPLRLNATERRAGEMFIGFGTVQGDIGLSASGDLTEAAAGLFAALHRADESDCAAIAVAPVPQIGLGLAINDRLKRAAAGSRR